MGTRICHADANDDADTNGIRIETNTPALTFGGGHNQGKRFPCINNLGGKSKHPNCFIFNIMLAASLSSVGTMLKNIAYGSHLLFLSRH